MCSAFPTCAEPWNITCSHRWAKPVLPGTSCFEPTPSTEQSEQAMAQASAQPAPTQGAQTAAPIDAGTILFQRHDTATDKSGSFTIKPDGSGETRIGAADADVACASFSSDGAII